MASNFDKNNSNNNFNSTPIIKLNKTTNITKIKGWQKKKFSLEMTDKEIDWNGSSKYVTQMAANSSLCATAKINDNDVQNICSTYISCNVLKVNRNSELLDNLVKKIGDTDEGDYRSRKICSDKKNFQLDSVNEMTSRSHLCEKGHSKICAKNNVSSISSSVDSTQRLTGTVKSVSFERSAFVSESLDNFLSNEPVILKSNDVLQLPSSDTFQLLQATDVTGLSIKPIENELKPSPVSVKNDLLDKHGNKPKTLAEKRRILENCKHKKLINLCKNDSEQNKLNNNSGLKRAISFKRKCKMKRIKRVLRSNVDLLRDHVTDHVLGDNSTEKLNKYDNLDRVLDSVVNYVDNPVSNDSSAENMCDTTDCVLDNVDSADKQNKYYNLDRVLDSVVNNTDSVSLERGFSNYSSKGQSFHRQLLRLQRPHLSSYSISKHIRQRRLGSNPLQKKIIKERLQNINKSCQSKKALEEIVYVKPLKKRIPYDFMSILNNEEIVKYGSDLDLKKKVGMLLFLGIGRCLYQEQLENLESLRKDTCIIDENFVKFATSTVLDRKEPCKISRVLVPVVSTKLLTFMNRYHIIRARYQHFLINRFKIKIPPVPSASFSSSDDAISRVIGVDNSGKNDVATGKMSNSQLKRKKPISKIGNTSLRATATSQVKPNRTVRPNLKNPGKFVWNEMSKSLNLSDCDNSICDDLIQPEKNVKSTDDETPCQVSCSNNEANFDFKKPNTHSYIKFKKLVLKNGRIFHKNKTMTKLSLELRRLNHDFLEIDSSNDMNVLTLNDQIKIDTPEIVLPNDVFLPNKLAKVESDFHQTIMKSNEEFVFVSTCGERSQRHRKLPKKLEGTVLSNEATSANKGQVHYLRKKLDHSKTEMVKTRCQISQYLSDARSPESSKCSDSSVIESTPIVNALPEKPKKDFLQDNIKDIREKETIVVQTSVSILKKNVGCNMADNAKTSSVSKTSSLNNFLDISELSDERETSDIRNTKLKVLDGKYPVLRLHKIKPPHSTRILCMDHKFYNCHCMQNKVFSFQSVVDLAVEHEYSNDKEVEKVTSVATGQTSGDSMIVPRIENVMTLRLEDFFKEDGSDAVPVSNNLSSLIFSKNNLSTNEEPPQASSARQAGLLNDPNKLLYGRIKRPRIAAPVRTQQKNEYRFFCVRFTYSFSYIKFFGGLNLNELPELKNQVLNNPNVDPNVGVILAYTGMLNMLRESFIKGECVFQRLIKANYNHSKFDNLPFGVYAVCRNMILFGPYEMNEPHRLQAFRVFYKEAESGNASEVKQIPFVKPQFIKEYQDIEFAVGYWWCMTNNRLDKEDDRLIDRINEKKINSPLNPHAPLLLIPVKLNDTKGQLSCDQGYITGVLNCDNQNNNNDTKTDDVLCNSIEKDKSATSNIIIDLTEESEPSDSPGTMTIQRNSTSKADNEESIMKPVKPAEVDSILNLNDTPVISLVTGRRLRNLGAAEESAPDVKKRYPVINLYNNQVMSVVSPENKDCILALANDKFNNPKVRKLVNDMCRRGIDVSDSEPVMLTVQPNGDVFTLALCKLKESGNDCYYSLKYNRQHVIKISNIGKNDSDKEARIKRKCVATITFIGSQNTAEVSNNSATGGQAVVTLLKQNGAEPSVGKFVETNATEVTSNNRHVLQNINRSTICTNTPVDSNTSNIITTKHVSRHPKQYTDDDVIEVGCDVLNLESLAAKVTASKNSVPVESSKSVATTSKHNVPVESSKSVATTSKHNVPVESSKSVATTSKHSVPIESSKSVATTSKNSVPVESSKSVAIDIIKLRSPELKHRKGKVQSLTKPCSSTTHVDSIVKNDNCSNSVKKNTKRNTDSKRKDCLNLPLNKAHGYIPITAALLQKKKNTPFKTNMASTVHTSNKIKHIRRMNKALKSTVRAAGGNHGLVPPVEVKQKTIGDQVKIGSINTIQSVKKCKESTHPNGVLLKVTVKSDSNIFKFKSRSGRLNADLSALVAALNDQVVKRKADPMTTTTSSLVNNIVNDKVILTYNDGGSSNATCSFVKPPSPHTLASNLKNTLIVWNSSTQSFNINVPADQMSDPSPAVSHSNLSGDTEASVIDVTDKVKEIVVEPSCIDDRPAIHDSDLQETIEFNAPQFTSPSNLPALHDGDLQQTVEFNAPQLTSPSNLLASHDGELQQTVEFNAPQLTSPSNLPASHDAELQQTAEFNAPQLTSPSNLPASHDGELQQTVEFNAPQFTSPLNLPVLHDGKLQQTVEFNAPQFTSPSNLPASHDGELQQTVEFNAPQLTSPSNLPASHDAELQQTVEFNAPQLTSSLNLPALHDDDLQQTVEFNAPQFTSPLNLPASHAGDLQQTVEFNTPQLTSPSNLLASPADDLQQTFEFNAPQLTSPSNLPASHDGDLQQTVEFNAPQLTSPSNSPASHDGDLQQTVEFNAPQLTSPSNLPASDDGDLQQTVEFNAPQLTSPSNLPASHDGDLQQTIEFMLPPPTSSSNIPASNDTAVEEPSVSNVNNDDFKLIITSVDTIRTPDFLDADIFNDDSLSIPLTPESTDPDFVDEDDSSMTFPSPLFDDESCSPSVSNVQLEEAAATAEIASDDDDVRVISETAGQFPKFALLKRTMMNLVKEAKADIFALGTDPDINKPISELKLVSNIDSLPNFLQSYGIHFTDED